MRRLLAFVIAPLALAGCDASDPLGLYPEPAREYVTPLELTGRVVDKADLLTLQQEEELTGRLSQLENDTGAQFVVVTTPSLDGYTKADYSLMLGRGWGIGSAERDDGLLLVIAPGERRVRIELGFGIEDYISDPLAKDIIDEDILPPFYQGDFAQGILQGSARIDRELRARLPEVTQ